MTMTIIAQGHQTAAAPAEAPLFSSAHAALTFAYNHSHQVYERPLMNRMADGPGVRTGKGLGGVDGSAQAGMVLSSLKLLPRLHLAIIQARFMPRTKECVCCRSKIDNVEWLDAIREISDVAACQALSTHPTSRTLRDAIIRGYFGQKVVLSQEADRAGVTANTVTRHKGMIVRWLRGSRTEIGADGERGAGQIGVEAVAMESIAAILGAKGICN
jgi:hypothetical protein